MKKPVTMLIAILLMAMMLPSSAEAADTTYVLNDPSPVNAGKDTGYSQSDHLDKDDPHWGWSIGTFYLDGYTRKTEANGKPLFLKNAGDTVTLWFDLTQDINRLNGNSKLSIARDPKGWDQKLGISQQDFGRGTLIVRHTDYRNRTKTNTYVDFLSAASSKKANTKVKVCEEGDYDVALDYRIRKTNMNVFGWKPFSSYTYYRISFAFSVRNGNSMVFPRDITTGSELSNASFTENGFTLDLAKSHYLDIDVRKSVLDKKSDKLVEDTRFNKPAADGQSYTDEGVYVITVTNRYTHEKTKKTIYVGKNDILKVYATTGLAIKDIKSQLSRGATIAKDGTLRQTGSNSPSAASPTNQATGDGTVQEIRHQKRPVIWLIIIAIIVLLMIVTGTVVVTKTACRPRPSSLKDAQKTNAYGADDIPLPHEGESSTDTREL